MRLTQGEFSAEIMREVNSEQSAYHYSIFSEELNATLAEGSVESQEAAEAAARAQLQVLCASFKTLHRAA